MKMLIFHASVKPDMCRDFDHILYNYLLIYTYTEVVAKLYFKGQRCLHGTCYNHAVVYFPPKC